MHEVNFHPDTRQLEAFCSGQVPASLALIMSAHLDMCSHCRQRYSDIMARQSEVALSESAPSDGFDDMLADILSAPEPVREPVEPAVPAELELDGRKFLLPRALRRVAQNRGNWSRIPGNLWQTQVFLGGQEQANFIYMEKGGKVPEHTHTGSEITLVINGHFSDGVSSYQSGDIMFLDGHHTHAPMTDNEEGCLVFSIVDKPLHFTSGLARLLNPFSHLFFRT